MTSNLRALSGTPASVRVRTNALAAICIGGLVVGTLDLIFAWIVFPNTLAGTLKVIAGGWYGQAALDGGSSVVAVGLLCHYCVAFGATATYWLLSRAIPWLNRQAVVCGLVYGIVVYEFMHLVVLPLCAYHAPVQFASLWKPDVLSHLFLVGLPIALIVRRYSAPKVVGSKVRGT